jgi:hypothetical protein
MKAAAAWAFTFQAGPVAASRSFSPEVADLGGGVGEQARDLGFEGAGADDLAERGVGGQRKQVAGDVEGAGFEGALVGLGLEGLGAGTRRRRIENGGGGALVGGEEIFDGARSRAAGGGILAEIGEIPAGFEEVLIAGGALLAVPALLVDQDDGGQQAEPLDGEGDVGQVGDGAVAVLKIKGVEELLGALGADFGQGLAHGERGAGVLGHGVGQDLGVGAVDGEDFGLVAGAGGRKDSLDMRMVSRTEYGMREHPRVAGLHPGTAPERDPTEGEAPQERENRGGSSGALEHGSRSFWCGSFWCGRRTNRGLCRRDAGR